MIFQETALPGAFVIELEPKIDERGFFTRIWCEQEFAAHGLNTRLVQASLSYTKRQGTLRGLHYQVAPYEEAKLVRCSRGSIYDVIIDLRPASLTYLRWISVTLTAQNQKMLYVPEGFAHGFQTLEDETEVSYHMTQFHERRAERGIRWDDPAFGIRWPDVDGRVIAQKDQNWPPFALSQASVPPNA
jgi:dTDP-4-dehydrorhamnose 3,5-epimerase